MSTSMSINGRNTSDEVDTTTTTTMTSTGTGTGTGSGEGVTRSVYSQVTVDPAENKTDDVEGPGTGTGKHQNRFVNGTLLNSANPDSPRNVSPDKVPSPSSTGKASRSPNLRSGRFSDATPAEHSPLANRMSTVPEDEVPADDRGPRKSVQFSSSAPGTSEPQSQGQSHTPTEDESKAEATKVPSLYSRLRALASSQHVRSPSALSFRSQDIREERNDAALSATIDDAYTEDDADEESGAEGAFVPSHPPKKKRKFARRLESGDVTDSAPVSPHDSRPELPASQSARPGQFTRPFQLPRRITDPDMVTGVSEDEGRRKLEHTLTSSWTPRHPLRGLSHGGAREERLFDGSSRPPALLTVNTGSTQNGNATPDESRPKRKQLLERGTTSTGARWRQIKMGLKALAKPKPKERLTQDQAKSAELLAELAAGAPAALMFASAFQRDEHGDRRIPALLEQLKVSVTDTDQKKDAEDSQHIIFRIELEYGNGVNRMRWVIRRALRDFVNMHFKYKSHYQIARFKGSSDDRRLYKSFPKFPKAVFPVLQGIGDFDDEDEEDLPAEGDGAVTDPERPEMPIRRTRTSFMLNRRRSSLTGDEATPTTPGGTLLFRKGKDKEAERERDLKFPARQRQMLEIYLQRLIKFMLFRPEANRLCRFLEISALGMRLASEGSYHGKEGYMIIRSAKGLDFRKSLTPGNVKNRHTPKWFLVRHSYIVCVDSPDGMFIYDVFLFDSDFTVQSSKPLLKSVSEKDIGKTAKQIAANSKEMAKHPQHHRLKLINSERRLKLLARNERVLRQFEESVRSVISTSPWCQKNRFDSFAPVRQKCFAQWLVDGRDHMWVVSRALDQAKDVIYIHDWWLSPELYMRRPAAISQKWRLDRILKRKAEQGVKIFIIVYRNIDAAIPIDSQYTKFSLLDLHPNIFVQRSPNQFRQNTFFWAHHEKLCIVDHTLAFVGGIDLCFGRWDTPQHILNDDKPTGFEDVEAPKDGDHCQLWPGKDYSNPRVQDFFDLFKPYEEMYNRNVVARMPWHDIAMHVVGQPARDLTRHFVQRWNYILRQRKPTRPTPFLLPPPDFNPADLEALGLDGTCEVQLLRSAGPWSIGTPDKTEHSIMNAYVKMIEESEHFVYMENQFFITSCETESTRVHNKIGDALVERIARAANNDEAWRAVIVIPLIPGFQNTVEEEGGTSVRLIMQYQYRSICRGESSIFGRLKAQGIEPEDYIQFYSLRQWGKIGPKQSLVTEQLYIHAKVIIVDDRIALIGSANINERSQLGNRDSEVAAVVRDTDMIWSTMNGEPYRVGRFAHTLRMRLMREHLGLDVDQIMEDAQILEHERAKSEAKEKQPAKSHKEDSENEDPMDARGRELREELLQRNEMLATFNHDVDWEQAGNPNLRANKQVTKDSRVTGTDEHKRDIEGEGYDAMKSIEEAGLGQGRDTVTLPNGKEVLIRDQDTEGHLPIVDPRKHGMEARLPSYVKKVEAPNPPMPPRPGVTRMHTEDLGLTQLSQLPALPESDDTDIGGPMLEKIASAESAMPAHPLLMELKYPLVDRDCMADPIISHFADDTWHTVAENNTRIYRSVFRCMPDNNVRDWNDYHEYMAYEQRFKELQGQTNIPDTKFGPQSDQNKRAGPVGVGTSTVAAQLKGLTKVPTDLDNKIRSLKPDESRKSNDGDAEKRALQDWAAETNRAQMQRQGTDLSMRAFPALDEKRLQNIPEDADFVARPGSKESQNETVKNSSEAEKTNGTTIGTGQGSVRRRRRGTTRSSRRDFSAADDMMSLGDAEELLGKVQGHLIEFPYDWLEKVEAGGNWLFPFDQISPIEIYI